MNNRDLRRKRTNNFRSNKMSIKFYMRYAENALRGSGI